MMNYNSNVSFWRDKLLLTDGELCNLFINNKRLFQLTKDKIPNKASISKKYNKLQLLMNNGYELHEIKRHSFVLTNPTLETLEKRLMELKGLNIQPKPPIAWLSQAKSVYESLVCNFMTEEQKLVNISEELNVDIERLLLLDSWQNMSAINYKEKLKFFLNKGYNIDQLIDYQRIGLFSLETIKIGYKELENLGSDCITLEVRFHRLLIQLLNSSIGFQSLAHYCKHNKLSFVRRRTANKLYKILECDACDIPDLDKARRIILVQKFSVLEHNRSLLLKRNFQLDDLRQCPLPLGHATSVLEEHLDKIENEDIVKRWMREGERLKSLNYLQYSIEKSVNFQTSTILHDDLNVED